VDLVLICNVLDISSAALAEGRLMRKPGVPELEELIRKLEEKMDELRESIREMKEAAAFLKNEVTEKGAAIDEAVNPPELSAVSKDPEKEQGKELEKAPETGTVQPVPNQAEPAGPVL